MWATQPERATKQVNGVTYYYSYDYDNSLIARYKSGTGITGVVLYNQEVWLNHQHIGTINGLANGMTGSYVDNLGSIRVTTDGSGNIFSASRNLPFGDGLTNFMGSSPPTLHFTGKERDAETGDDYFGARYYSSTMGRFLTPDWSLTPEAVPYADLENPQTLNLYSYVANNPLSNRDADGHFLMSPQQQYSGSHFGSSGGQMLLASFMAIANDELQSDLDRQAQQPTSTQRREAAAEKTAKANMQKYGGSQPADKGPSLSPVAGSCGGSNHTCQYSLSGPGSTSLYVYEHQTSDVTGAAPVGDGDYVDPGLNGVKASVGIFYDDIGGSNLDTYRFFTVSKSATYDPTDQTVVPIRESGGLVGFEHMYSTGGPVFINGSTNISPEN